MVHSFTCAGVLPTQYIKMCEFAGVGHVGYGYMKKGKLAKHVLFAISIQCTTTVDIVM